MIVEEALIAAKRLYEEHIQIAVAHEEDRGIAIVELAKLIMNK